MLERCLLSRFKSNRDPLRQPFCTHYWQSCHFKHVPNPLRNSSQMQQYLRLDLIGFFFSKYAMLEQFRQGKTLYWMSKPKYNIKNLLGFDVSSSYSDYALQSISQNHCNPIETTGANSFLGLNWFWETHLSFLLNNADRGVTCWTLIGFVEVIDCLWSEWGRTFEIEDWQIPYGFP